MIETSLTVGFIGLGAMGGPMARNILSGGFRLVVNDIRKDTASTHLKLGAAWADSPGEVAEQSDVILTCLPSVDAIENVAIGPDGVLSGLRKGHAHFEMSTNAPKLVAQLHAAYLEQGAHFLDAPITGGAIGAKKGKLTIFVGGDQPSYERFAPVLRAIGDRPIHVGPSGTGIVTKLVNNCAGQTLNLVLAEIFALAPIAIHRVRQQYHQPLAIAKMPTKEVKVKVKTDKAYAYWRPPTRFNATCLPESII